MRSVITVRYSGSSNRATTLIPKKVTLVRLPLPSCVATSVLRSEMVPKLVMPPPNVLPVPPGGRLLRHAVTDSEPLVGDGTRDGRANNGLARGIN
jgi:hypothetical protein